MSRNKQPTTPTIRCAIYTRKSCEEGLELEFNSLDAQRESAEAFIASQQHEGWVCLPDHYDDGGFSGSSMQRPALHRLSHSWTGLHVPHTTSSTRNFRRIWKTPDP
jgi:site-specific DNA recombinase